MSTADAKRIKVLLVDDDSSWGEGLDVQSRRLPSSQLDVEFKNRFADGLQSIQNEPDIDVVVVDLFLDDKLAFDFIIEARKLGAVVPFIIVSQATKQDIVNYDGKDLLSEMIQSSAVDFLEKENIKPFRIFQQRIQDALSNFHRQTEITISNIEKRQREYLFEAFYVISELRLLRDIIYSYAKKVKVCAFENICSAVDDRLNTLEHFLGSAYYDLEPEQGKARALTPRLRSGKGNAPASQSLAFADLIPYSARHNRIKKRVIANWKNLQKRIERRADIFNVCKALYSDLTSVANDDLVENVFFQIAKSNDVLSTKQSVDVIYQLSLIYEKEGKRERIPALDAAAAIMLIDDGKMTEAATYLKSARRRAAILGNDMLVATIDAIVPDEASLAGTYGSRA